MLLLLCVRGRAGWLFEIKGIAKQHRYHLEGMEELHEQGFALMERWFLCLLLSSRNVPPCQSRAWSLVHPLGATLMMRPSSSSPIG